MSKENVKTSHTDAMPKLAKFVSDANFEFEIATLPGEIEEITDMFLDTHYANTIETRRKLLNCKKFILDFCQVVDVDLLVQIENFSKNHGNV
jgi:hypothetical protein